MKGRGKRLSQSYKRFIIILCALSLTVLQLPLAYAGPGVLGNPTASVTKESIPKTFKVKVRRVNTQNYIGKNKKGRSGLPSTTSDFKKAIVTLKAGDKIELV